MTTATGSMSAGYGTVWVPSSVASDWAPYRDGHWAYIESLGMDLGGR